MGWNASQRRVLVGFVGILFIYGLVRLILNPAYVPNPMPPVPPAAAELDDRIDPNLVDWPALAAMPNIGEKRAREIVAYREQFVVTHPGEIAFKTADDLAKVRGIGPAIVSQISKYLRFGSPAPGPSSAPQP